eukprot:gene21973-6666_t
MSDDDGGMSMNFVVSGAKLSKPKVNPNTKSYKAAKRKRVEEKKRTKANPRLPPPNHPMRAVNAGVNIKPPNKGDSVRAAMRSGKSPSMLGHKEEPRKTNFTSSPFSSRSSNR